MPTTSPPQQTRINLANLKLQIAKNLGLDRVRVDRSQQYFSCLNQLLDQKASNAEFNKCCLLILGRENIPLHNHLVRSILENALLAKTPPPLGYGNPTFPPVAVPFKKSTQGDSIPNSWGTEEPMHNTLSNGNLLPASPRKVRSGTRDRRIKDRPSPLGSNGRADVNPYLSSVPLDSNVVTENGILSPCDFKRMMQNHQAVPKELPPKRSRTQSLVSCYPASFRGEGAEEALVINGSEEVDQGNLNSKRGSLHAPLGIPFCHASVGGAKKSFSMANSYCDDSFRSCDSGELCSTETLKKGLDKIAGQGLEGVTVDCSDLLKNGLDAYLRRLITSCADIVRARQGHHLTKHPIYRHHFLSNHVDGMWPENHMSAQRSSGSLDQIQEQRKRCPISLQDLRVALELNPQQLGEDWPLLLEKICLQSYNE